MNNEVLTSEYISLFNDNNGNFGTIDCKFIESEEYEYDKFYYYFPMIERLVREILHHQGEFDLDSYSSSTFRTLFSIITLNKDSIKTIFGEDIYYYLDLVYTDEGIRNEVMHSSTVTKHHHHYTEYFVSTQYFFIELVKLFVKLFIT